MLNIRKMQIETTVIYHLIPVKLPTLKSLQINAGVGVEKREHSYILGRKVN